jgi:hypothetical protein
MQSSEMLINVRPVLLVESWFCWSARSRHDTNTLKVKGIPEPTGSLLVRSAGFSRL